MQPALELAQQLIACPSVTPDDGGCLNLIEARLQQRGFVCERMPRGGVDNLWATRRQGQGKGPHVCFAGHVDVVPTGPLERWTSPPFTPTLRDGRLYGRGAADMKSGVAAAIVAFEQFIDQAPDVPAELSFLLTADEEGDAVDGTVVVVDALAARGIRLNYVIIGEPTAVDQLGDTIKNGRRGSLSGKLTVLGVQGHIAYPHLSVNPVHRFAAALATLCDTVWDRGNADFEPTTWQVSNIHAGTGAGNVIPGQLVVDFNFRFGTASSEQSLKSRVVEILTAHGLSEGRDFRLDWTLGASPFLTQASRLIPATVAAIARVTGVNAKTSTAGGTSDGRFIVAICDELLECGMVNASSHKIDENVAAADVDALSAIYFDLLNQLLCPAASERAS